MPDPKKPQRTAARKVAPSSALAHSKPVLKFRIRITDGDSIPIGPGKVSLLEAIETTGSITAAAKSLQMSYRRAWLLLDEMNRMLKAPAVASAKGGQQGGGSIVTAEGHKLITLYRRIEADATKACQADIKRLTGLIAH